MASAAEHQADRVRQPFAGRVHERRSATLGMWAFLAQEVLFFGVVFGTYAYYRFAHPEAFAAAASHTDWGFGASMTAILLVSSATMVFAVRFAQLRRRGPLLVSLGATLLLGAAFLAIKGVEYSHHIAAGETPLREGGPESLFWSLYYVATGLHALHVLVGLGILAMLAVRAARDTTRTNLVVMSGLYWHLVDIVWIFLFPLLYLIAPTP